MRVDFTTENKSKGNDRYPKFALEKDETARVSILESPIMKFVHVLQAPVVDPMTGEHQKVVKKTTKGEEYETEAYEFVSQSVCTGVLETVQQKEIDPENCPACKDVADHPDKFSAPTPKYVCHIVRYKTQPGTVQPQNPFQAELVLWVLTQRKFDKIVNIAAEFGDPRTIDLQVGPCTNKSFQNYEMAACNGTAAWSQSEANKNFVSQLWAANAANEESMTNTVARPLQPVRYSADSAKVLDRYAMIGSPQAQTVGNMEFGGAVQASQQFAQQNEQPAPWSQQGPPSFAQPQQEQSPAQPQQEQAPTAPTYDAAPAFPGAPQQQAPAFPDTSQQPQQAPEPSQQPQWQQPAQQGYEPPQQAPAQPQGQPDQSQQPAQQGGGEVLDFSSLMKSMQNPQQ